MINLPLHDYEIELTELRQTIDARRRMIHDLRKASVKEPIYSVRRVNSIKEIGSLVSELNFLLDYYKQIRSEALEIL